MGVCIEYKDTIRLAEVVIDGYGNEKLTNLESVPALFVQNTGFDHNNNQDAVTADAIAYIDPANEYIQSVFNRLEGMLVIANRFGSADSESWYRITDVAVGEDKLLDNRIDNIQVLLKKSTAINYVS